LLKPYRKRIFWTLTTVSIMAVIFALSAQNGTESEQMSGGMRFGLEYVIIKIFGEGKVRDDIIANLEFIIRKAAHIFIYLCLGFSAAAAADAYGARRGLLIIAVAFCMFYAATDEAHQYFIEGRSSELRDVLIDTAGSAAGAYAFILSRKRTAVTACPPRGCS